ncbi:MAG: SGNH/GDSL hydrolase family protein [Cryomorphaceae bacterium]|nr:SGNH/GDSL hydrolase family protein [Cryomorphaceae bacterium]
MSIPSRRKFIKTASLTGILAPFAGQVFSLDNFNLKNDILLAAKDNYLDSIKQELVKQWPKNRTINLVFHGHSVPSGYFKTPDVRPLQSYPHLLLKELKQVYPYAVINTILTCIGGENAQQGAKRFKRDVLNHKPDVLFIDYALNDRRIGLEASRKSWEYMIKAALKKNIKVILLTATPDQKVDLTDPKSDLQLLCNQIMDMSTEFKVGLVDSYALFQKIHSDGYKLADYMSQVNHPNEKGHQLVVDGIMKYF